MRQRSQGEIKRSIQEALNKVAALPADNEEHAIHEIRKCVKSARALLRLLGPEHKADATALGTLGRKLSRFRDAEALLETFDGVRDEYAKRLEGHEIASIRDGLLARKMEMQKGADAANLIPSAALALRRVAGRIAARPLADTSITEVFNESMRRSKKAFAKAHKRPGPETLHDWRKRVKAQFYQLQFLQKTPGVEKQLDRLHDIGNWLGDDHNLAVLRDTIFEQPAFYGSLADVELFLDCAASHERDLRKKALALGPKIYKRKARRIMVSATLAMK